MLSRETLDTSTVINSLGNVALCLGVEFSRGVTSVPKALLEISNCNQKVTVVLVCARNALQLTGDQRFESIWRMA